MTFEQKKQIVIDNSFKVDCNINMTLKEAYEKGFNRGLSKTPKPKVEQPQGEWLWLGDSLDPNHRWSCNKCGRGVKEEENFCPNCGIMMQKGGN